jgi:hypothetical protein
MLLSPDPVARPFFRILFAVLTVAMAAAFAFRGASFLFSDAPVSLSCSSRRRGLCELGAWMLRSFVPPAAHGMVLGILAWLGAVFMAWLTWLILFRAFRKRRS